MTVHEHSRYAIWNPAQHPYMHAASEFSYRNQSTGSLVTNVQEALDWMFAFAYPQSQASVQTVADLPAVGNNLGDMRFVYDDGDGRGASYRWLQAEGELTPGWKKWADVDWGAGSILEAYQQRTSADYVHRRGYDDLDANGDPVTGLYAGQVVYGGVSAGSHLTLRANSGDGTGSGTGYVQVDDHFRPAVDGVYTLGNGSYRFLAGHFEAVFAGDVTIQDGEIISGSGAISFGDNDLSTTGTITSGTLALSSASITDSSGTISFGSTDLQTTGEVSADRVDAVGAASAFASGTTVGTLTLADGSITDESGTVGFGADDVETTGSVTAASLVGTTGTIGSLGFATDTITSAGALNLVTASGLNVTGSTVVTGTLSATGALDIGGTGEFTGDVTVGNLALMATGEVGAISGDLYLWADQDIVFSSPMRPNNDGTRDLGDATHRFHQVFLDGTAGALGGGISDGTNLVDTPTLLSLRNINSGVSTGMSIFWDGSKWVSSLPDTEVDHNTISNLDVGDVHTQYALLAGRSGGQTITGGTAASNNLVLESTSNGSKGNVVFASSLRPSSSNALDLGSASYGLRDAYIIGQLYNARIENNSAAPSASASTKGRLYFNTTDSKAYVDIGGTWKKLGAEKYVVQDASGWTGSVSTVTYTVSSEITDARLAVWAFYDNSSSFKQIYAEITLTATQVTVTTSYNLPAGTYTLVGVS